MRDDLVSAAEVAKQLGVSRASVYRLVHRGALPKPVQVGGVSRWRQSDVDRVKDGPRRLRKPRRPGPDAA